MSDLLKRCGIIKVNNEFLRESPEMLLEIFKDVLVTDVKVDSESLVWHFRGVSKHFDIMEKWQHAIPFYMVKVKTKGGKLDSFKFIKEKYGF